MMMMMMMIRASPLESGQKGSGEAEEDEKEFDERYLFLSGAWDAPLTRENGPLEEDLKKRKEEMPTIKLDTDEEDAIVPPLADNSDDEELDDWSKDFDDDEDFLPPHGNKFDGEEDEEIIECINVTNLEYNKDAIRRRKAGAVFTQEHKLKEKPSRKRRTTSKRKDGSCYADRVAKPRKKQMQASEC